ncbi:cystathionine gamma-synthase [Limimonas halophila]|uniref:Cystathionine gamma-synthase n=1 Tax=Limimonas halophila TaxID=1082479 RepID=A0A1G7P6M7_9PROT|nr:PLP-dependent transferase [Limimonas halophila]SDF81269.1 cystathionine gamma-synthase [Limimonas halophila]
MTGEKPHPETRAAHGAVGPDPRDGAVVPPLQPASTFVQGADEGRSYARDQSPGVEPAERLLAELEGGGEALLFASGMAAATAMIGALRPGDHIVAQRVMYWGLRRWLTDFCAEWGIGLDFVDAGEPGTIAAAVQPGRTRVVWIETPANPTWDVVDIAAAAEAAHEAGAWLAVDNTVPTPVHTRPLAHGADVVFHSATKMLNGHSDIVAGALVTNQPDHALWHRVRATRAHGGGILGPFEAWLLLRGMRTLYLRAERAAATAQAIAEHFDRHPKVNAVLYPGLQSHPGHATAARQMERGFGGMLSLRLADGRAAAERVPHACRTILPATSLGGVESLIEHRAGIEGADSPVPGDLVRLSVGIEHPDDLIADLEQALDRGASGHKGLCSGRGDNRH